MVCHGGRFCIYLFGGCTKVAQDLLKKSDILKFSVSFGCDKCRQDIQRIDKTINMH
jgi:hypothetical protein